MGLTCATRFLKNAKFLHTEVGLFPGYEPLDGFPGLSEELAKAFSKRRPPTSGSKAVAPLFSGTLRFVETKFDSSGTEYAIAATDFDTALKYAQICVEPISAYASQYGKNSLGVGSGRIPFSVTLQQEKYNDQILAGWTDEIARREGFGPDSCLIFLNPQGVVNSDADATRGVLGYHSVSKVGIPYAFVNVMGEGLTPRDESDSYALALSHEIAEMTVDPAANGSNPEVCDSCAGNCNTDERDYFDSAGNWVGGTPSSKYAFFIAGIATPDSVSQCPAPKSSCSYPPPRVAGGAGRR